MPVTTVRLQGPLAGERFVELCRTSLADLKTRFPFAAAMGPSQQFTGNAQRVANFVRRLERGLAVVMYLRGNPAMKYQDLALNSQYINALAGGLGFRAFNGIREARVAAGIINDPALFSTIIERFERERAEILGVEISGAVVAPVPQPGFTPAIMKAEIAKPEVRSKLIAIVKARLWAGEPITTNIFSDSTDAEVQLVFRLMRELAQSTVYDDRNTAEHQLVVLTEEAKSEMAQQDGLLVLPSSPTSRRRP